MVIKSSVVKSSNVYSTARKFNWIIPGRNKIRNSPLNHCTVSISRLWFTYCANQYSMFGVDMRKADLKSEQNDTSGRGARARNIYSSARQFQRLESKQNRTYNIIIHFNRRSVSISPLTCLFYRREVSFTIHHKFLLVYITLFQLSTLYSIAEVVSSLAELEYNPWLYICQIHNIRKFV